MDVAMVGTNVDSLRKYIFLKVVYAFLIFHLSNCLSFHHLQHQPVVLIEIEGTQY